MNYFKKTTVLVSALALSAITISPAHANSPKPVKVDKPVVHASVTKKVTAASPKAKLTFVKTSVRTEEKPKPVVVAAPVQVQTQAQTVTQTQAPQTTTYQTQSTPQVQTQQAQPEPTPVVAQGSGRGGAILGAAMAQLGQFQDCTALVERALRAVGVAGVGDESPASLARFGVPVGSPQPGDILVYSGHVAIYAGNGMAVHGGWLGNRTEVHEAHYGGPYSVYRVM